MLRGFCLEFAGAVDKGNQRQVNKDRMQGWQLVVELPDRFEKRKAFDIANGAANLAQHEVDALIAREHELLDFVGDVGNDLDRAAQIVAAALLGQDRLVDPARGDVIALAARLAGEPFVVS